MGSIPESGRSPGGGNGNPLQYSSILAWEILWTEKPVRLQSMGPQKSWIQLRDQTTITGRVREDSVILWLTSTSLQENFGIKDLWKKC